MNWSHMFANNSFDSCLGESSSRPSESHKLPETTTLLDSLDWSPDMLSSPSSCSSGTAGTSSSPSQMDLLFNSFAFPPLQLEPSLMPTAAFDFPSYLLPWVDSMPSPQECFTIHSPKPVFAYKTVHFPLDQWDLDDDEKPCQDPPSLHGKRRRDEDAPPDDCTAAKKHKPDSQLLSLDTNYTTSLTVGEATDPTHFDASLLDSKQLNRVYAPDWSHLWQTDLSFS
ncbi:hypothetical protein M422DRAFT_30393 [Sphaerobolus stellatus SS14]|uniref:Uncharacterized protein n=1 Tax=Sphaerobolus stellatus (strain SS14) TaxID=990650 RepID=A0A0C9UMD7_SPHS4|nr:hypothetical protein M422DRAFT_30393 [Sphaerobolus stellatus SS14]